MPIELSDQQAEYVINMLVSINDEDREGWEPGLLHHFALMENEGLAHVAGEALLGPELIGTEPRQATYTGLCEELQGKTALVSLKLCRTTSLHDLASRTEVDYVVAQFDDPTTGYGFGWHKFGKDDFTLIGEQANI